MYVFNPASLDEELDGKSTPSPGMGDAGNRILGSK